MRFRILLSLLLLPAAAGFSNDAPDEARAADGPLPTPRPSPAPALRKSSLVEAQDHRSAEAFGPPRLAPSSVAADPQDLRPQEDALAHYDDRASAKCKSMVDDRSGTAGAYASSWIAEGSAPSVAAESQDRRLLDEFEDRWWGSKGKYFPAAREGEELMPFDCETYKNPIQVFKPVGDGKTYYEVSELPADGGIYQQVYSMNTDARPNPLDPYPNFGKANAAAMWINPDSGKNFAFAAFQGGDVGKFPGDTVGGTRLCSFDRIGYACLKELPNGDDAALKVNNPIAATIIGNNYYYAAGQFKNQGVQKNKIHTITNFAVSPVFDEGFFIDRNLGGSANLQLADFTSIEARGGREFVKDDCDDCDYLVGLARRDPFDADDSDPSALPYKLFLGRLNKDTGLLESYLLLKNYIDWAGRPGGAPTSPQTSGFGSAVTYTQTAYGQRIFFTANDGWGVVELALPIDVTGCPWPAAGSNPLGATCDVVTKVTWRAASEETPNNDGMNCKLEEPNIFSGDLTLEPTFSPTPEPTVSSQPSDGPTQPPSEPPSDGPTFVPTFVPSDGPTFVPSDGPTFVPSDGPTFVPSDGPTFVPSDGPTLVPSAGHTAGEAMPSSMPSAALTPAPTAASTRAPTVASTTEAPTACKVCADDRECPAGQFCEFDVGGGARRKLRFGYMRMGCCRRL